MGNGVGDRAWGGCGGDDTGGGLGEDGGEGLYCWVSVSRIRISRR